LPVVVVVVATTIEIAAVPCTVLVLAIGEPPVVQVGVGGEQVWGWLAIRAVVVVVILEGLAADGDVLLASSSLSWVLSLMIFVPIVVGSWAAGASPFLACIVG
jgi:hypothetical protein